MTIESSSSSPPMSGPLPAAPLPFDMPKLKPVRRITGMVHSAEDSSSSFEDNEEFNARTSMDGSNFPPALKRRDSFSGNILLPTQDENKQTSNDETTEPTKAYWIQRKIRQTSFGSVRIGFVVEPCDKEEKACGGDTVEWKVTRSSSTRKSSSRISYSKFPNDGYHMVAIKMLDKAKALKSSQVMAEISALEMVTKNCGTEEGNFDCGDDCHVITAREILEDARHIYIITPYYGEGSLFQYVQEFGRLDEEIARHFFRQILKGLQTLQQIGLCHRGLSMHNVLLGGTNCIFTHLCTSLRIPSTGGAKNDDSSSSSLLEPQTLVAGIDPQFMAPEILRADAFDGYAVDLWASGIILFAMLFGNIAPFVWAAPDDRRFRTICVNGDLESIAAQLEAAGDQQYYPTKAPHQTKKKKEHHHVSEKALDLLQNILRADPEKRLTLQQVLEHPWVVDESLSSQPEGEDNSGLVPPPPPPLASPLQYML